jgi:predicted DNA-binding WGR domain protein
MFEIPTKLTDYRCSLEAVDRSRNIARGYRIRASRDLFGHTIVDLHWGRIGCRGAGLTVSFENDGAARSFIKRTLAKRASAPQRFGVSYLPVDEVG